jgi:hypothetical protein
MRSLALSILAIAILGTSGCFGPAGVAGDDRRHVGVSLPLYFETGVKPQNLTKETYWLVLLTGLEEHELKEGPGDDRVVACNTQPLYELDSESRTLHYNPRMANLKDREFRVLVIIDYEAVDFGARSLSTGCPSEYRIEALNGRGEIKAFFDHFNETVTVQAYPFDGTLGVQKRYVLPVGHGVGFEYTQTAATDGSEYWVFGQWYVQNLGAWPLAKLEPSLG